MHDSFIQIFSIRDMYFSQFLIILKPNQLVPNQARYYSSLVSLYNNINAIIDTSFNSIYQTNTPTLEKT